MTSLILASIGVFLVVIILLVIILLVAKSYLSPSGEVTITMNGEQQLKTSQGGTLLGTLSANNVFLSSACGGKGSCGQCPLPGARRRWRDFAYRNRFLLS